MQASASVSSDSYSDSLADSSASEAQADEEQIRHALKYDESDGNCLRGLVLALGTEVFAALLICCAWQALHFAR
jgi:hypothetical protein